VGGRFFSNMSQFVAYKVASNMIWPTRAVHCCLSVKQRIRARATAFNVFYLRFIWSYLL